MHERPVKDVLAQLEKAPSLALDRTSARAESIEVIRATAAAAADARDVTPGLLALRADLAGLPFRTGRAALLSTAQAGHLARGAADLQATPSEKLAARLAGEAVWRRPERIPALMQVLMVAPDADRVTLARHLGGVAGKVASVELARIALYDPAPEVRHEAITALGARPAAEHKDALLAGFASPWPVVAEHAAEALVALRQTEAAPALVELLLGPDPHAPYSKGGGPQTYVKELVRIDHRNNCLACHCSSFAADDPLRAAVPPLNDSGSYYAPKTPARQDAFVRADVTYLRQNYSVMLGGRRFDLLVRERAGTAADAAAAESRKEGGLTQRQQALAFAVRELSGV
jgi:hypothetical protein